MIRIGTFQRSRRNSCTNRANTRDSDSGQTMAKQGRKPNQALEDLGGCCQERCKSRSHRKRASASAFVESALLRRSRHASRRRQHVVLYGDAERALVRRRDVTGGPSIPTPVGDRWPDDVRLSDLEPKFTCSACGKRGADIRPDFHWDKPVALSRGY